MILFTLLFIVQYYQKSYLVQFIRNILQRISGIRIIFEGYFKNWCINSSNHSLLWKQWDSFHIKGGWNSPWGTNTLKHLHDCIDTKIVGEDRLSNKTEILENYSGQISQSVVVLPRSTEEVAQIITCANMNSVVLVPVSSGTPRQRGSYQPKVDNAIIFDLSKMNKSWDRIGS